MGKPVAGEVRLDDLPQRLWIAPSLGEVRYLYQAGKVAITLGVGYPNLDAVSGALKVKSSVAGYSSSATYAADNPLAHGKLLRRDHHNHS